MEGNDKSNLSKRAKQIRNELKEGLKHKITFNIMRWLPGIREEDDRLEAAKRHHSGKQLSRKEIFEEAKSQLDKEESMLLQTVSRIHPQHDREHRNRFSYHGDTHQQNTDDFASIIETLTTIRDRISPQTLSPTVSAHQLPHVSSAANMSGIGTAPALIAASSMPTLPPNATDAGGTSTAISQGGGGAAPAVGRQTSDFTNELNRRLEPLSKGMLFLFFCFVYFVCDLMQTIVV